MRCARKILSFVLAAAMTVSLAPSVSFAEPEETSARPSISDPTTDENYTGGIGAIDWGGADWGKFASVDWTDAAEMSAADLAAKLNESGINALTFEDELTYENGVLSVGDTPIREADLGGITLDGNTVTFPKGDTALIIPADNFGALEVNSETVFDIPDDSNAAVIAVAKDGAQPHLNYTIWGYDPFTVNTNKNGNLAVVNLIASDYSSQGILINNELNIGGTGTVAIVGGKSESSSIGVNAKSVNVNGASLIATTDFSMGTSRGIYTARLDDPDEHTGNITADNGARIISVRGGALSGSVGIETINISAKNGSEIYAYGGIVPDDDGDPDNDTRTIGLQIMEGTAKRTITADNGGKIYACAGNGEYQYGVADAHTQGEGGENNVAAYGCLANNVTSDGSNFEALNYEAAETFELCEYGSSEDSDPVSITVEGDTSNIHVLGRDGAVKLREEPIGSYIAKCSYEDDDFSLDKEKGIYVDANGFAVSELQFTAATAIDYGIYFDGETGRLYKTFNYVVETGEVTYSDPIEVPGAKCEKNKLTLTSDFQFYTDHEDGLYLGEGTTLYVPEGENPSVYGAASGLTMSDDNNIGGSSGIFCLGDNTLDIDGDLKVTAGGGKNISSWGILGANKDKTLNITGKGSLTALGGNVVYDETIEASRGDSCGIISYGDLNISIAELNAIGGESYICSSGIYADYPMIEPHTVTVSGGAKVNAKGGVCVGGEYTVSNGCAANHVIIKDNSSLTASTSAADESYGLIIFDWENYSDGKIELSGGGSLDLTALDSTYGCGVTSRNNKPVIVKMDSGCKFTAEGAYIASVPELSGVNAVSDGKTVKYDSEKSGYVDADGNFVKKLSFEPIKTASTTHRGGGSSRPKATATPKPTASPAPSATTEPTSKPQSTAKPNDTAAVPFTDVAETDWFYNAVKAVYKEGIMDGVSDTEFAPNMTLTRGMLVTIVGRMGAAEPASNTSFADVAADAYYAQYVAWTAENGIVTGFDDGTFRPDEIVTREQAAAILYRYMNYIGADVSAGENTNILSYTDANEISEYAVPAIQWACGAGIINGYPDGSLAPKNDINRAESAAMLSAVSLL